MTGESTERGSTRHCITIALTYVALFTVRRMNIGERSINVMRGFDIGNGKPADCINSTILSAIAFNPETGSSWDNTEGNSN